MPPGLWSNEALTRPPGLPGVAPARAGCYLREENRIASKMLWWALQDYDDPGPYAVMALDQDEGLPRRYVPGQGLLDWPSLAMYVFNGEPGAHPIDQATAVELMKQDVGKIKPEIVASSKGQAPDRPAPGVQESESEEHKAAGSA
jgi:hypothetical protein